MLITIDTTKPLSADERKFVLSFLSDEQPPRLPLDRPEPTKKAPKPKKEAAPEPAPEKVMDTSAQLDEAVRLATELVSNGKRDVVKAALGVTGAARVTDLEGDPEKLQAFMGALANG